ncbi:MAG: hypothetical protein WA733_02125, partial [Methylocystis sp.]
KQMIVETRAPIPAAPGRKARHDYEYERNGVAHLFMMFAPLEGWRHVKVTDRHAAIDYAPTCSKTCPEIGLRTPLSGPQPPCPREPQAFGGWPL